jgi:hypothetical protein
VLKLIEQPDSANAIIENKKTFFNKRLFDIKF